MNNHQMIAKTSWQYLLLSILLLGSLSSHASHNVGLAMQVTCISACEMRIDVKAYRDCSGASQLVYEPVWIPRDTLCTNLPLRISGSPIVIHTEITPVCPSAVTQCANSQSTIMGVEEHKWSYTYQTCQASACVYDIQVLECCRNLAPTTLNSPYLHALTIHYEGVDLTVPGCNNSPVFPSTPLIYACAGQPQTYYLGGSDPDGDSLAYSLAVCWDQPGDTVDYLPGIDFQHPMGTSWDCRIDSFGILHLQPQPGAPLVAVVCIRTDEYRNGILVGSNYRDMQVVVLQCNANQSPVFGQLQLISGTATVVGMDVYACPQSSICLEIAATDPDTGQATQLRWDQSISGATFTDALNPLIADTVWSTVGGSATGRFCWTPTTPGIYNFGLTANDDFCPIFGAASVVVRIHVGAAPFAAASVTTTGCLNYVFSGSVGGCTNSSNFTYQWTGGSNINSNAQSFSHYFPTPGLYPWQLVVSDGQGFQDTLRDTILVQQSLNILPLITGGSQIDFCTGPNAVQLTAAGGYQNYHWSTGATATGITVASAGTYTVTVEDPSTGCLFTDIFPVDENPVPISGVVTSSFGQPMAGQQVLLLRLDNNPTGLTAIDTAITDSVGYYQFCNVSDTGLAVRVEPNQSNFPTQMPTYADSALVWNQSLRVSPTLNGPQVLNIHCLFGQNLGGTAGLGGIVLEGPLAGPPVEGLRVFIRNQGLSQLMGYRETNALGYFEFLGLALGDYEVVPDFPFVNENLPPFVQLTTGNALRTSLDFRLHPTWLELLNPTSFDEEVFRQFEASLYPNPMDDLGHLSISTDKPIAISILVLDAMGKPVKTMERLSLPAGRAVSEFGAELPAGMYFLHLQAAGQQLVIPFAKL